MQGVVHAGKGACCVHNWLVGAQGTAGVIPQCIRANVAMCVEQVFSWGQVVVQGQLVTAGWQELKDLMRPSGSSGALSLALRTKHVLSWGQVVVQGLLFTAGWQDLKDLTRPFGSVARADIAIGPDGRSKGWGTVLFDDPRDAQAAINVRCTFLRISGKKPEKKQVALTGCSC